MKRGIFYLKLFIVFLIAFFISHLLVTDVFISYSPTIRSNVIAFYDLRFKKFLTTLPFTKEKIDFKATTSEYLRLTTQQFAPGVRAASETGETYIEYKVEDIKWKKTEQKDVGGNIITVEVPEGMPVPPPESYHLQ
jgi:hypothetical protein